MRIPSFLLVVGLLWSYTTHAQNNGFISIGLRSNIGGLKGLNHILQHYNEARPWLAKELSQQRHMTGIELGIERNSKKFGISFAKTYFTWNNSTANGTSINRTQYERKVSTRSFGVELFDFWYTPVSFKGFSFGGGIMPIGLGMFRVRTKLDGEDWIKVPLSDLENSGETGLFSTFHAFSNLHLDILSNHFGKTLHFQFFYSANWFRNEYNLFYLNRSINPSSYSDLLKSVKHQYAYFGLKLSLIL